MTVQRKAPAAREMDTQKRRTLPWRIAEDKRLLGLGIKPDGNPHRNHAAAEVGLAVLQLLNKVIVHAPAVPLEGWAWYIDSFCDKGRYCRDFCRDSSYKLARIRTPESMCVNESK